jgi:hypothetical protein
VALGQPEPEAARLLAQNLGRVHWGWLSSNPGPEAVRLLQRSPEKIDWAALSANPSPAALRLLEAHPERVDWVCLAANPAIFEYDYAAMRAARAPLAEALARERFHPRNLGRFEGWGF